MKKGYGVFGKSYEIMNKNDLHDINSIDHRFMQEMILLDESSYDYLYNKEVNYYDMTHHELFEFSKQFKGNSDKETINNVLIFTRNIVKNFNVEFEDMFFRSLTPLREFSRTLVRLVSISSALAPGYEDMTMITFASNFGNLSKEMLISENTPNMARAMKISAVVTGLLTAFLYMLIFYYSFTDTLIPSLRRI